MRYALPKECRIAKSSEFRRVYSEGRRFEGRLMTLFLRETDQSIHRLGVTASKKGIGKAYQRNRTKRLLRECFRLSSEELAQISNRYDWVLNARRGILKVKLDKALIEFRQIVQNVKDIEHNRQKGE